MRLDFMKAGYVADAVITRLRLGNRPTEDDAAFLDSRPLIDALRHRVSETDIQWLVDIVNGETDELAGLACSLLRKYSERGEVRSCFEARWPSATAYLKNRLMWRMLDSSDLPREWHERFRDFILAERRTFSDFNLKFYGRSAKGISNLITRIADPSFPASKKWIYVCCIPDVIEDGDAARAMVQLALLTADPFAKEVADELHRRQYFSASANAKSSDALISGEDDNVALDFVADSIVSHLRAGQRPNDEEADCLNRLPLIDALRARIEEQDLTWLWKSIEGESGEVAALYLSLLRKFTDKREVQTRLMTRWDSASPFMQAHLMWRILDAADLPTDWHRRLFEFVLREWATFQSVSLKFLGTRETVLMSALRRIGDSSFPDSKKWAYLCRVPEVAQDQKAARALLTLGILMKDSFAREVAEVLLIRFFQEDRVETRASSN